VRDRNPFKDLRVRLAVYQAIDIETIVAKVLRGQARPAGSHLSALWTAMCPNWRSACRTTPRQRAGAGRSRYPHGFSVTLDCVNVTFHAAVCRAIASILAQVSIGLTFQPSPSASFFSKLTQATAGFFHRAPEFSPTTTNGAQ
jgi:peptide/nickel transport system substrate-binding protein